MKKGLLFFFACLSVILAPVMTSAGNELNFDGTNDYVALPALNFNSTNFTIEGWVRWDALTGSWTRFFDFGNGQANNNILVANPPNSNTLRFDIYNGGSDAGQTLGVDNVLYPGQYYHIAAVANAGTMYLYVNGVLVGSISGVTVPNVNRTLCYLGHSNFSGEGYFNGQMDEVRIWNVARSASQISNDMIDQSLGAETGLIAYYNFDEGTAGGNNAGITTLTDLTANHYDGTLTNFALTGATSNWVTSIFPLPVTMTPPGNALAFDGGSDYVSLPAVNFNSTNLTIEGWMRWDAIPGNFTRFIDLGNGQGDNNILIACLPSVNTLIFDIYNGATRQRLSVENIIPLGQYIHIGAVVQSGTMKLYVNGVLTATTSGITVNNVNRTKCYLGHSNWATEPNLTGQMDEVSIWNIARTSSQIQSDMGNTLAGNESGLLAYYNFDEGTAGGNNVNITPLFDKTGNNHGTLNYFVKTSGNTTSNFITSTAMTPYAETSLTATSGGTATGMNQAVNVATDAVVTGSSTLNGANVQIVNFVSGQDQLGISGSTSGTVNGITYSFNATTGIMALTGFASPANYQTTLRLLTYKNTSATPTTTARTVAISLGTAAFNDGTGHFYQYLTNGGTWSNASVISSNQYYLGKQGYLATITSASENATIKSLLQGDAWIGSSDAAAEGVWKWVTGPEADEQFWQGNGSGHAVNSMYANWNTGQPDNSGGNEDYGEIYSGNGAWNDLPGTGNGSYIVEYGGMAGDPASAISANVTVNFNTQYSLTATVGGAETTANTAIYIAADAVVNAWTVNSTKVQITNYISGQDQLGIDGATSGTVNGISYSFDAATAILTLTNTTTAANYQATLRKVTYKNLSNSPNNTTRSIKFSLGHFYEYISGSTITWTDANTAANARTYFGLPGYLATITSAAENSTCHSIATNRAWLGGSDNASEGVWKWVTGPEAGTQFWQGNSSGHAVNGMYTNWPSYQPDNLGGSENYLEMYTDGMWNDFAVSTLEAGYLAEYGGMAGDPAPGIIANGNVTLGYTQACAGNALAWDGGADYVTLPAINFNTTSLNLTVEGWMRWNSNPGNFTRFFDFGNGYPNNNILVSCVPSANNMIFDIYNGGTLQRVEADNIIPYGQFIHVAAVVESGTTMKLYVNGVLKGTTTGVTVQNVVRSNCYLGHSNWPTEPSLTGQMDEVSIWTVARTLTQIQSDMYTPLTGNESGLMAYYNFDQGTAGGNNTSFTTLFDITGNYNGGNLASFWRDSGHPASNFTASTIGTSPTLAATTVSGITGTSANVGSNITDKGWGTPTVRGVCYNTTGTPTIANDKVSETGSFGTGAFSENLINLVPGVTYYARAFTTNTCSTSYGAQVSFIPEDCSDPTSGGTNSSDQTICYNTAPHAFTNSADASGYIGTLEYQWQSSTAGSGSGFTDIGSATASTYTSTALTTNTWFRRLARVSCMPDWSGAQPSNVLQIIVSPLLSETGINTNAILCHGDQTTVTITVTGGTSPIAYTFNGVTNATGIFTGIGAGNYNYSVTDANTCGPITGSVSVGQPSQITKVSATPTDPGCYGGNGSIAIVYTGGTGTLHYTIGTETNTTGNFSRGYGIWNYSVTDDNTCGPFTGSVSIGQPSQITYVSAGAVDPLCYGGLGTITILYTGGTGTLHYIIGTENNTTGIFSRGYGNWAYSVTDANNCTGFTGTVSVGQPSQITYVSAGAVDPLCYGGLGTITILYTGGTGTLHYIIGTENNTTGIFSFYIQVVQEPCIISSVQKTIPRVYSHVVMGTGLTV
ncbi:MAG: lectin-like protein [Bacteroidetes bacterium]|nr:lectin-like protein [Bacteroidota bacterium]